MKFYKKLKELRIAHNETQQELAEHLNLSFQSISKWKNNQCMPNIEILIEIAKHYNVTVDSLINDKENVKKETNSNKKNYSYEFHPKRNSYSLFSIFLDSEAVVDSNTLDNRHLMPSDLPYQASINKQDIIIAVNNKGKIIYMAQSTGYGYGSPCDRFYHHGDICEIAAMECFNLFDDYQPYDNIQHPFKKNAEWLNYEFLIPQGGFVLTLANNSMEWQNIYKIFARFSSIEERWGANWENFKIGQLDNFILSYSNNALTITYNATYKDEIKSSISEQIVEQLIERYLKKRKNLIQEIIDEKVSEFEDIESRIDDLEYKLYELEGRLDELED